MQKARGRVRVGPDQEVVDAVSRDVVAGIDLAAHVPTLGVPFHPSQGGVRAHPARDAAMEDVGSAAVGDDLAAAQVADDDLGLAVVVEVARGDVVAEVRGFLCVVEDGVCVFG